MCETATGCEEFKAKPRSGFGLNELLGRKVSKAEAPGRGAHLWRLAEVALPIREPGQLGAFPGAIPSRVAFRLHGIGLWNVWAPPENRAGDLDGGPERIRAPGTQMVGEPAETRRVLVPQPSRALSGLTPELSRAAKRLRLE